MAGEQGKRPVTDQFLVNNSSGGDNSDENQRNSIAFLDEDIPEPAIKKPRELRDVDEEMAVTERYLKTKIALLRTMKADEHRRAKNLVDEIAALNDDLSL